MSHRRPGTDAHRTCCVGEASPCRSSPVSPEHAAHVRPLPSHRSRPSRDPARLVAPQPSPKTNIKQSFEPSFPPSEQPRVPCPANSFPQTLLSLPCASRLIPHSPLHSRCSPPAISCLGASQTPAVGARPSRSHAGVREPSQLLPCRRELTYGECDTIS